MILATLFVAATEAIAATLQDYQKYVFSVRIEKKNGESLIQTGFRVSGMKGIVTALHGVAAGVALSAANETEKALVSLQIKYVDVSRDLAILSSTALDNEPAEGLIAAGNAEVIESNVIIPAHPKGIALNIRSKGSVGTPARFILGEKIPPDSMDLFVRRGSPSKDKEAIYLEAALLGGESGAPVLQNGKVIGVGNGGISGSGISWAIPLHDADWQSADKSKERLQALANSKTDLLFSVPVAPNSSKELAAKLMYAGTWEPVTFQEANSGKFRVRGVSTGTLEITFDADEQLQAKGHFAIEAEVLKKYGSLMPGDIFRFEGTINSMNKPHQTSDSWYYSADFQGRFKTGTVSNGQWISSNLNGLLETQIYSEGGFMEVRGYSLRLARIVQGVTSSGPESGAKPIRINETANSDFAVTGVSQSDPPLNVRSGPSSQSRIRTTIPWNATGIRITGDTVRNGPDEWAPIKWKSTTGWVNRRFLSQSGSGDE